MSLITEKKELESQLKAAESQIETLKKTAKYLIKRIKLVDDQISEMGGESSAETLIQVTNNLK